MMWSRRNGYHSRWYSACFLVLALSLWFFCALPSGLWAASEETSPTSEPDWPELRSYLDEIGLAFQSVSEATNSESERLQQERLELENEKLYWQQERAAIESERQSLSEERKRLDAEKQDSRQLGLLLADMQVNLDDAQKRLKRGWIWIVGAALLGGGIGYAIGR